MKYIAAITLLSILMLASAGFATDVTISTVSDFSEGTSDNTYVLASGKVGLGFYDGFDRAELGSDWTVMEGEVTLNGNELVLRNGEAVNGFIQASALNFTFEDEFIIKSSVRTEKLNANNATFCGMKNPSDWSNYMAIKGRSEQGNALYYEANKFGNLVSKPNAIDLSSSHIYEMRKFFSATKNFAQFYVDGIGPYNMENLPEGNLTPFFRESAMKSGTSRYVYIDWIYAGHSSGTYTSKNIAIPQNISVNSTRLEFEGVDSENYIDRAEWLNSTGDVVEFDDADIKTGTSYTYNKDLSGLKDQMNVKIYFVGNSSYTFYLTKIFVRIKNMPNITLTADPVSPVAYGTPTTFTCSVDNTEQPVILMREGIPKTHENGIPVILASRSWEYEYSCSVSESENYAEASVTIDYYVDKASPALSLNSTSWSVTEGTETTVKCSTISSETAPVLYRDGVIVSNPDVATLSPGTYNYTCNIIETDNYLPESTSSILTVNTKPSEPVIQPPAGGPGGGGGITTPTVVPKNESVQTEVPEETPEETPAETTIEAIEQPTGPTGLIFGLTRETVAGVVIVGISLIGGAFYHIKKVYRKPKRKIRKA